MKYYIYLDDVRTPIPNPSTHEISEWIVVRNYDEFVAKVTEIGLENIALISLDHDLGDTAMMEWRTNVCRNFTLNYDNIEEKTGMDCAHWVVNKAVSTGIYLPITYVHSANPVGAENISNLINNYYKKIGLSEKCVPVRVEHRIGDHLTNEELKRRWSIMNEEN